VNGAAGTEQKAVPGAPGPKRTREFPQSILLFWTWFGPPALVTAVMLGRLGLWGLWVFAPAHPAMRMLYGYGPLLLAGVILLALLWTSVLQRGVVYEVTPSSLVRRQGRSRRPIRLDGLFVSRNRDGGVDWVRLSSKEAQFLVLRVFMPKFDDFASLVEAGSRIRRNKERTL